MAHDAGDRRGGSGEIGELGPRTPILNAPPIVAALIVVLVVSFFVVAVMPPQLQAAVLAFGAVSPPRLLSGEGGVVAMAASLSGHMLLHDGLVHLGLNNVWLLAFGAPVARRMGADGPRQQGRGRAAAAFVAFFAASGAAGALVFAAAHSNEVTYLMGASGGVSGLLGALVRFAFRAPAIARPPQQLSSLLDESVLVWSLVIIGLNVFVGLFSGAVGLGATNIAWEAHVGGYLFGLVAFPTFLDLARARRA